MHNAIFFPYIFSIIKFLNNPKLRIVYCEKLQIKQITQNRNNSDNRSYLILTFNDKFGRRFDLTRRACYTACERSRILFICGCNE